MRACHVGGKFERLADDSELEAEAIAEDAEPTLEDVEIQEFPDGIDKTLNPVLLQPDSA